MLEDLLKAAGGFTDEDFASMPAGSFGGASGALTPCSTRSWRVATAYTREPQL